MTDYDDLRAKALAATPGEWRSFYRHKYNEWHVSVPSPPGTMRVGLFPYGCPTERPQADAEYIAAANPATVLALLDEIAALRETMLERDGQWLEMIALCDEHMAKIETPMESPSADAWITVSKNLGVARVVIESRHKEAAK